MARRMLVVGDIPAVTDGVRDADDDDPSGYLGHDRVRRVLQENSWIGEAAARPAMS